MRLLYPNASECGLRLIPEPPALSQEEVTATLAFLATKAELLRQHDRSVQPRNARIILVAPNPAIDVYRDGSLYLGGALGTIGSILASRAIPTIPLGFLGSGPAGQLFREMARDKSIDTSYLTPVADECRFTVYGSRDAKISRPGPRTTKEEVDTLFKTFRSVILNGDLENPPLVLLSGSISESFDDDATRLYHDIIHLLRGLQAERARSLVWVDARGAALFWAAQAKPDYVKVNRQELAELIHILQTSGQSPQTTIVPRTRAQAIALDAQHVITTFGLPELTVTMDKDGALTAWSHTDRVLIAKVTRALPKPYTAGLGDTLLAMQAIGQVTGQPQCRSLEYGVAAARASAEIIGTTLVTDPSEILPQLAHVRRRTINVNHSLRMPQNLRELRRAITKAHIRPVVVVDMDGALTPSGMPITKDVLTGVLDVLDAELPVVILTSSSLEAAHTQVLADLCARAQPRHLKNVYVFAAQGSQAYGFAIDSAKFERLFLLDLADPQILGPEGLQRVKSILNEVTDRFKLAGDEKSLIADRTSQITLMVLGRNATNEAKEAYDNNGGRAHRLQIADHLNRCFKESHLRVFARPAGKSSINITPIGVDKAFGIRKIADCLGVLTSQMIYIGDEFWAGGVDSPVVGQVLAAINVGPSVPPTPFARQTVIGDVRLGPLGTVEVLRMVAGTQRGISVKRDDESMPVAA
jgi:phosphomannomutase